MEMAELLRRMLPAGASMPDTDESLEFSFALEYRGPPVAYDLPRVVPIDIIDRIPSATVVPSVSLSDCDRQLPIIQPLPWRDPLRKLQKEKLSKDVFLGSDSTVSPRSVIAFQRSGAIGSSDDHGRSNESAPDIDSSGVLGYSNSLDQLGEMDGSGALGISHGQDRSGEIVSPRALGFSDGHNRSRESLPGIDSSSVLGVSNGKDQLCELSGEIGSSGILGSSYDCKESVDFSNEMNPPDWVSSESVLSSRIPSSNSSRKAEDCDNVPMTHANRTSIVTFRDSHLGDIVETESSPLETGIMPGLKIRKGSCYRCFKGTRFTEKEVCIVCNAKYCSNCVLRAMGSMPEGRKCVTCIGFSIDESKRESLGKCSRMLKRLLSAPEIQLVMKAEKSCEANQLQPDHVFVNGNQLCQDEMVLLHSCSNSPSKLKPGRYWYDKESGLWGKEGHKPCKIISPHLNIGGTLKSDASNGNTQVFINNREITKVELWMLQWAGVQCAGNPHFWLDEDGSYQEEGQKNIRGNIWDKNRMKLVCSILGLPIFKSGISSGEEVNNVISRNVPGYLEQRILQKILLVGWDGSGTNTIFKQAKFLYQAVPFSEEERQNIKCMIQSNVYNYLGILLEGRERFEEKSLTEISNKRLLNHSATSGHVDEGDSQTKYSINPRLKAFSDWLLKVMASGNLEAIFPAATREYAPVVEELWKDDAVQATYSRRNELQMLPSVASYFLERVVDISRMEYEPSDMDILYAEGITSSNGLTHTDFLFPQSAYDSIIDTEDQHDPLLRYELIRVHAKGLGENCKWLEMFDDVQIVIFCVALSDYDQFCDDGCGVAKNKMLVIRNFFESIVSHPTFEQMDFLLILNKFDQLEQKIERVPLTVCEWFDDFNPVTSRNSNNNHSASPGQQAFYYIAIKFKRFFASVTGRKLYVSVTNGLEVDSVDQALRYAREILKWEEDKIVFSINSENSVYSTEASSSP